MFFLSFVFFLIGILSGTYSAWFLFLLLFPIGYLIRRRKDRRCFLLILFVLIGYLLAFFYPKGSLDSTSLTGIVVKSKGSYYLLATGKGRYYIYSKGNAPSLFSIIELKGYASERKSSHFENSFRFDEYLKTQGVYYQFNVKERNILFNSFLSRDQRKSYACSFLDKESSVLFSSLLFKDSLSGLSNYQDLSALNLPSRLSLSGFHLEFLLSVLAFLLGKKHGKLSEALSLLLSLLFLFISGFSYSFRRIRLYKSIRFLFRKAEKKASYPECLSLTAGILLFLEPYSIKDSAFYYSFPFLFVLAIFSKKKQTGFKGFLIFYFQRTLFYLPYHLLSSYSFSLLSPVLHILLIPYSHLLFLLSVLLVPLPFLGVLFNGLAKGYLAIASFGSNRSPLLVRGKPKIWFLFVYYFLFFFLLLFSHYSFPLQKKKTLSSILLLIFLCPIPSPLPIREIVFVDVGQGDCTLIRNGYSSILIDTGGNLKNNIAEECLIPYFRKKKIRSLEGVILTHYDFDHAGALEILKEKFPVKAVYDRNSFLRSENNTLNIIGLRIENLNTYQISDESNDCSGVYRFSLGKQKILIRGDAPIAIEKKILDDKKEVGCDILKAGHHGSKTSSSYEFLKAASPKEAIISVGYRNSYGLPSQEVLDRLDSLSIPYYRTDEKGSIERTLSFSLL